jgi:hypothetical protein
MLYQGKSGSPARHALSAAEKTQIFFGAKKIDFLGRQEDHLRPVSKWFFAALKNLGANQRTSQTCNFIFKNIF